MTSILKKRRLNSSVTLMKLSAPNIAKHAKAGQFIILRVDSHGERIPLTIADHDAAADTVTIIYQTVGTTTMELDALPEGGTLIDLVGPLGEPTHIPVGTKRACVVGGGVGCAMAYSQAKALHNAGIPHPTATK